MRADHLGCYGYERPTSPHLDRLAKDSLRFTRAFGTSSWTTPSWMSLFTGLLPSRHGLIQYPRPGQLPSGIPTLPELLQEHDYLTVGFHGGGHVSDAFGFDRGFDRYESWGPRFEDSLPACLEWLRKHRQFRFFLFWHGFDCHRPYDPPAEYDLFYPEYSGNYDVTRLYTEDGALPETEDDVRHVLAKYDGEILHADFMIGQLLEQLEELQLLAETVLIITSDHGDEFLEHECFDHTRTLYDELIHVPLLVRMPWRSRPSSVEDKLISLVDVGPLIADWLGLPFPACDATRVGTDPKPECVFAATGYQRKYLDETEGQPWQQKRNRPELLRAIRTLRWKLLFDRKDEPVELYDLRADPRERRNLVTMEGEVVPELLRTFRKFEEPSNKLESQLDQSHDVDDEVLERLRGLGYL
ncbi:MAG: sulfatase [Anaerolineae bacterium]